MFSTMPLFLLDAANGEENALDRVVNDVADSAGRALHGDTDAMWRLFENYGLPVVWAVIILLVTLMVAKLAARMAGSTMDRTKIDATLSRFFSKLAFYAVLLIGMTFALSAFGINITTFAAVLAAAGFAIGMALSGTLGNFASGVMLLIFRPFRVGDVVSAAGITAKVNEIELFTTTFDTPDNRRIIIPNGAIYGGIIENITMHSERRVDVNVGVEYAADIDKTREVLDHAAQSLSDKMVQGEGRGYAVVLLDLGDSSVNWVVRFWCSTANFWAVKEQLTRAVKQHLDQAGLGIPFPQMDVHLHNSTPAKSA